MSTQEMSVINEENTQDVTHLSKIIACGIDKYKDLKKDNQIDPYTMFIVNSGDTSEETPIVDLYYGDNKLSQMVVVESLPSLGIVGRVYIKTVENGTQPAGIYLCQGSNQDKSPNYLCLTNLAQTGNISESAVEQIVQNLYTKIQDDDLTLTWKEDFSE